MLTGCKLILAIVALLALCWGTRRTPRSGISTVESVQARKYWPYNTIKHRSGFSKSKTAYYSNTCATFNYRYLELCGDINPNPGPTTQKCPVCSRTIAKNHRVLTCECCCLKIHIKCSGLTTKQYKQASSFYNHMYKCICPPCLNQQLPFANVSNINSSTSSNSSSEDDLRDLNNVWYTFDVITDKHRANMKMGHINANSIAGFKFYEIKNWLLSGKFDLLIISETKIDETFPDSHFFIDGFRMCRVDRKLGGGGLMAFVRSDLFFSVIRQFKNISATELSTFRTESIILKVKLKQAWIAVVSVYRPPSIPKHQWKYELSTLFEAVTGITNDVYMLGDFNCDLMHPNKPPMDGCDLNDLLDIYNFTNLINSPTRIDKTSETLLDIILTNNKAKTLLSGVIDVQISDHSLVYTILRRSAPRIRFQANHYKEL